MGDENSEMMNLDLNLGPNSSPDTDLGPTSLMNESLNLEDWIEQERTNAANLRRIRARTRSMVRQRWLSSPNPLPFPAFEARNIASEFMVNTAIRSGDILQTGEGSASLEESHDDVAKESDNKATHAGNEKLGGDEEKENTSGDEGNFFDCNICLDVSSEPVLTSCGHLFCWACLHQWLNVHSDAKECPVCKGEVTMKNLTPIYGRGNNTHVHDEKTSLKIPDRPQARRVESWRQMIRRNTFTIPMDEMFRRLGSGFSLSRDILENQTQSIENLNEELRERNSSLLNQILTSRGLRQEQPTTTAAPPEDLVDVNLTQNDERSLTSFLQRSHTQRLIDSYIRYTANERGQEQTLPLDDRDSVSSIAAVIRSESQTLDTAVEIDSTVSLSTSSSRRRIDVSRVSDVDSGDTRAPRRRRLN